MDDDCESQEDEEEEDEDNDNVFPDDKENESSPSASSILAVTVTVPGSTVYNGVHDPISTVTSTTIVVADYSHHNNTALFYDQIKSKPCAQLSAATRSGTDGVGFSLMDYTKHHIIEPRGIRDAVDLGHHIHCLETEVYSSILKAFIAQSDLLTGIFFSNRMLDMYAKCGSLVDAQIPFDEIDERDLCSWNIMIGGYAKLGRLEQARKLFDEMPHRDNFSWNVAISGYVSHDRPLEALELFRMMQRHDRSNSNKFTLSSDLCFGLDVQDMVPMSLSLSHNLSRFKLKFNAEKLV